MGEASGLSHIAPMPTDRAVGVYAAAMVGVGHRAVWTVGLLGAGLSLAGCAGTPRDLRPSHGTPTLSEGRQALEVVGDWNDVAASVRVAAGQCEAAVVDEPTAADAAVARVLVFVLVTATDEPASVRVERAVTPGAPGPPGPPDAGEGARITVSASVGRFDDPARSRRLAGAVARRLEQLAGKATAPAR